MQLYPYQREAVDELLAGKYIVCAGMGMGKTAMMMTWLKEKCEQAGKEKILIVTTPSKRDSGDMEAEADEWNGKEWRASLSSFEVISWHGLAKWEKNLKFGEAKNYVFGFDEVAKAGAGISSGMGTAFLKITKQTRDWAGFTGTPGDTWMKFYPYFVATGKVRNKTAFRNRYVQEQTFKGFPEIVGYNFVDELDRMWRDIAVIPDTSVVESQLPEETSRTIHFKTPTGYRDIIRTRRDKDGNLLETNMALCHYLRQACFSKQRQQWLSDFIENLGTNCVFFCNYIEEEETLCEIANKVLPDGAKVWRIDGSHHDIPTAETIGKYDIVVAHYASGGEALNLQFINYWVSVSPNYSYSVSKQAKGRIRRIGQRKPMFFFHCKCDGTIEDAVFASLQAKKVFSEKEWCIANNINEGE